MRVFFLFCTSSGSCWHREFRTILQITAQISVLYDGFRVQVRCFLGEVILCKGGDSPPAGTSAGTGANAQGGVEVSVQADVVVAADGAGSKARSLLQDLVRMPSSGSTYRAQQKADSELESVHVYVSPRYY